MNSQSIITAILLACAGLTLSAQAQPPVLAPSGPESRGELQGPPPPPENDSRENQRFFGGPKHAKQERARRGDMGPDRPHRDIFESLCQPELIMLNQNAIGLSDEQSSAIKALVHSSSTQLFELVWQQSACEEALATLLKQYPLDEKRIAEQFDKLLSVEDQIKRERMQSLVKIANVLTKEQQEKLRKLGPEHDSPPEIWPAETATSENSVIPAPQGRFQRGRR